MQRLEFPEHFLWGAATAAYQVEGGIENTDWAQASRTGRVPPVGDACDHFNRFESDFAIAASLGHNAHRFSVEWARIEPKEGVFDDEAIEHYRAVLRALRKHNMEPMVTLWHFTLPTWFVERGGWLAPDAHVVFARYCAHVVDKLGDLCTHFTTMNECMVYAGQGWVVGVWPPFLKNSPSFFRVVSALVRAHRAAYFAIKNVHPSFVVSIVHNVRYYHANSNPLYRLAAWGATLYTTRNFIYRVRDTSDALGLNYYRHTHIGAKQQLPKTDIGWEIYPEGIYHALMLLKRYKKPIYVTEAGCADATDHIRPDYIRKTVAAIHRAYTQGVDVRGHFHWSLLDNYEWAEGFDMRFGLVEVDFETQERRIRPSALVYKDICVENALTIPS